MARPITTPTCHPDRKTVAFGLCGPCYRRRPTHARMVADKTLAAKRLKLWGITPQDMSEMLEAQAGLCAICCEPMDPRNRGTCVDHSHKTGQIRGLLCWHCNVGIGHLREDSLRFASATDYLSAGASL